ncbi:MAG: substrate-binding domain-containing protein [Pseudomonadota bacterium]
MKKPSLIVSGTVALMFLLANGTIAQAAEVIVLSSGASRSAISALGPLFENSTGHKATIKFANNPILKKQVEEGVRFDVIVIEPGLIDGLIKLGHVAGGARVDIARVGMSLGALAGTPKSDMSTVDSFVGVLKKADSIAYTADGHSGTVFLHTLEKLGLLDAMKPKLKPAVGRTASSLVVGGEAQMWAGPISTPTAGTQIVGRFPQAVQTYVGISAAISASANAPDVARMFIKFLISEEAGSVFTAKGFEPLPAR